MEASISVDWVGQVQDSLKLGDGSYNWVYKGVLDKEKRAGLSDSLSYELASGAEDRSRTYTPVKEADFESAASTIPPLRHRRVIVSDCTGTAAISQAVRSSIQKR